QLHVRGAGLCPGPQRPYGPNRPPGNCRGRRRQRLRGEPPARRGKVEPARRQSYSLEAGFCRDKPRVVDGLEIRMPRDIAVRGSEVFLLDSGNKRILKANGPDDLSWWVSQRDPSWSNPYGLGIDPASGRILLADTGNHRIVEVGGTAVYGHWGSARGELRFPRHVGGDGFGVLF